MIIKGSSRGHSGADTARLARHLLSSENEIAEILALRGVSATGLQPALDEMRAVSLGTRARRGLYHSSISPDGIEAAMMDTPRWLEAADELERHLGLVGHQRAVVLHSKRGRSHLHIVWGRANPNTLKVVRDSQNYARHEACARELEKRWNLRPVIGVHTRAKDTSRPVAIATHADWQAQERTGIAVDQIAAVLQDAWQTTRTGKEFAAAVQRAGLSLAQGRRGIVAVDPAGTVHALPRRLKLGAVEVQRKLADIDPSTLMDVIETRTSARQAPLGKEITVKKTFSARAGRNSEGRSRIIPPVLAPDYWQGLGLPVTIMPDVLVIMLPGGTMLHDRGDRLTLTRDGEPTADEIRILVAAGKDRGWKSIHFHGGSAEFQRAARAEAVRQGYRLDQISLECEESMQQPVSVATPVPDHIKRRLAPPVELTPPPPAPALPDPTPHSLVQP